MLSNKALRVLCISAVLVQVAACGQPAERSAAGLTIFSPTLRQALAQRQQVLSAKRTALSLSDGATVNSCESYLKARKAGAQIAETVAAQLVASEYLLCEAMDLLPAKASGTGRMPDKLGTRVAKQLDLRTFPSSLGPQLDAERYTLAALSDAVKADDVAAAIEDESSTLRFEVVAEADINRDGKQDWIIWMTDESRDGNYRGYATLVVDDVTASGPLRATAYSGG